MGLLNRLGDENALTDGLLELLTFLKETFTEMLNILYIIGSLFSELLEEWLQGHTGGNTEQKSQGLSHFIQSYLLPVIPKANPVTITTIFVR